MNGFLPIPVQAVRYSVRAEMKRMESGIGCLFPVPFFFSPRFISFHPLHHPRDHFWTCLLRKSTNMRHGEKHTSFSIIYTCHMHSEWACRYASRISPGRVAAAAGVMGGRLSHVANSTSLLQIFASQPRRNSLEAFLFNKKPSTAAVRFLIRLKEKPWR